MYCVDSKLNCPGVYLLVNIEEGSVEYVGMSNKMLSRVYSSGHHKMRVADEDDRYRVVLIPTSNVETAKELEYDLISVLLPKENTWCAAHHEKNRYDEEVPEDIKRRVRKVLEKHKMMTEKYRHRFRRSSAID